ncbi:hypothetical protein DAEQUDRAFT_737237 [Daedalea quercina L-15889]|uniref:Protein-S-isoprenylcysteine O-methyltransferase n=1 Tax=Daedalea quercina L-15889 TaxID=1314783 RepID=A0A165RKN6_9APHY|nr:hypothetical protein DAEQUDRAFT_737237 [Daedalea quercina L-15889]
MSARTAFHIALLGVAAYMTGRSNTSPTPPPKDDEVRRDVTRTERVFSKLARQLGGAVKYTTWASAGCAAAVLIAHDYPGELSTTVLQRLLPIGAGGAARIQPTPYVLAGCGLTMLGAAIRFACFRTLDRFFTFEVTVKEDHQLCTRGPYSVVRHPSYTGYCMQTIGVAMWNCCAGSWAREAGWLDTPVGVAVASVFVGLQAYVGLNMIMRCSQEDMLMRKQFGEIWDEWARRVPYRLVPFIY